MNEINIKYPTRKFDFAKISLTYPKSVASGSYFTKILFEGAPLYLQIPKCTTKQGLVKMAKKMTSELLLDNMNEETVGWFENLDNRCKDLVQANSEEWFGSPINTEDIDNAFGSTIRLYKSGKFSLVKTNIKVHPVTEVPVLSVYNEQQVQQSVESITADTNLVAILEITGIRFTSRNFNLEIEMKQVMIVEDCYEEDVCFNRCVIVPRGRTAPDAAWGQGEELGKTPDFSFVTNSQTDLQGGGGEGEVSPNSNLLELSAAVELSPKDGLEMETPEDELQASLPEVVNSVSALGPTGALSTPTLSFLAGETPLQTPNVNNEPAMEMQVSETQLEGSGLSEVDILQPVSFEEILPSDNSLTEITLNKPEQIYYELYRKTKQKAKETLLEAKRIKEQYQLDVSDLEEDSDEEDDDEEER
jgi:hypothetical protein